MVVYSLKQSEKGVGKAYLQLMDKLSAHVTLLAKEGKPFSSIMGVKRGLYRFKSTLCNQVNNGPSTPLRVVGDGLALLVGDVLDKFDLDVQEVVEVGLLGEKEIKKALAKYDYKLLVKQGMTGREAKTVLSEKYGFSTSIIEKLIYVRGNNKN